MLPATNDESVAENNVTETDSIGDFESAQKFRPFILPDAKTSIPQKQARKICLAEGRKLKDDPGKSGIIYL
jgi:hypothetical protein